MILAGDATSQGPAFSMALVVQLWWLFDVHVTQILVHRQVSRTEEPDSCVESVYSFGVCVSWVV